MRNAGQASVDFGGWRNPYFGRQVVIASARKALMAGLGAGDGDVMLL
jgi:hypothetical protein